MNKYLKTLDYTVDLSSGTFGLANIQSVLGIILLVLSICSILYKFVLSIVLHIKNKQYGAIETDFEKAKEEIEQLKRGVDNGNKSE